jgi:hypothetical protein
MRSIISPILLCISTLFSVEASAHVRWFVSSTDHSVHFEWHGLYYLLIALAAVYALVVYVLDKQLTPVYRKRFFKPWRTALDQWMVLAYACGLTLILISFERIFLAPNLVLEKHLEHYLMIQALCGVALVSALSQRISGVALFVLCLLVIYAVSMALWIDYIAEFMAVSIALVLCGNHRQWALTVLRWGLGLQLMILAVHNKLLEPALGLEFLKMHPWNFMQMIGVSQFDDLLFVFAAGLAELTFGLLILLGIGTRVVIATVAVFFFLTSVILGMHELVGHIPIMACCLVLLSEGGGYSFKALFGRIFFKAQNNNQSYPVATSNSGIV